MSRLEALRKLVVAMGNEMGVRAELFVHETQDLYEVRVVMPILAPRVSVDPATLEDSALELGKMLADVIRAGRRELFDEVRAHMARFT